MIDGGVQRSNLFRLGAWFASCGLRAPGALRGHHHLERHADQIGGLLPELAEQFVTVPIGMVAAIAASTRGASGDGRSWPSARVSRCASAGS